jgi:hypothetical protein
LNEAEQIKMKETETRERMGNFRFEDDLEALESSIGTNFELEDFLNPKKGTKRWLEEQPERLRVMIDEKKYKECVNLIDDIRDCNLEIVDYDVKLEIDQVYNYLIEKLTISISVMIFY